MAAMQRFSMAKFEERKWNKYLAGASHSLANNGEDYEDVLKYCQCGCKDAQNVHLRKLMFTGATEIQPDSSNCQEKKGNRRNPRASKDVKSKIKSLSRRIDDYTINFRMIVAIVLAMFVLMPLAVQSQLQEIQDVIELGDLCSTTGTRGFFPPTPCREGLTCVIFDEGQPEVDLPDAGTCQPIDSLSREGRDQECGSFGIELMSTNGGVDNLSWTLENVRIDRLSTKSSRATVARGKASRDGTESGYSSNNSLCESDLIHILTLTTESEAFNLDPSSGNYVELTINDSVLFDSRDTKDGVSSIKKLVVIFDYSEGRTSMLSQCANLHVDVQSDDTKEKQIWNLFRFDTTSQKYVDDFSKIFMVGGSSEENVQVMVCVDGLYSYDIFGGIDVSKEIVNVTVDTNKEQGSHKNENIVSKSEIGEETGAFLFPLHVQSKENVQITMKDKRNIIMTEIGNPYVYNSDLSANFVELFNPTSKPVNLKKEKFSLIRFPQREMNLGNLPSVSGIALKGIIEPMSTFVLCAEYKGFNKFFKKMEEQSQDTYTSSELPESEKISCQFKIGDVADVIGSDSLILMKGNSIVDIYGGVRAAEDESSSWPKLLYGRSERLCEDVGAKFITRFDSAIWDICSVLGQNNEEKTCEQNLITSPREYDPGQWSLQNN